jgi:hypothetical protein
MTHRRCPFLIALLSASVIATLTVPAYAACSSPTANAGGREYFTSGQTYKLCTGTTWVNLFCVKTDVTSNMIAHWRFDESSGTTAKDTASTNDGTLTNGPTWSAAGGQYFGALSFDGSNDLVNSGSAAALDNLAAFTLTAWIKPTNAGQNNRGWIIAKATGGTDLPTSGWRFGFTADATNALKFSVEHSTSHLERTSNANPLTMGVWSFVTVTWTGSTTATSSHMYVNGTEVSYSFSGNGSGSRLSDASGNLYIGNNYGTPSSSFNGLIDDVRIYNRVLTPTEISTLSSGGTCITLGTCTTAAQLEYDTTAGTYKYCDGTNWVEIGANSTGWLDGVCATAAAIEYDATNNALIACDGADWVAIGK